MFLIIFHSCLDGLLHHKFRYSQISCMIDIIRMLRRQWLLIFAFLIIFCIVDSKTHLFSLLLVKLIFIMNLFGYLNLVKFEIMYSKIKICIYRDNSRINELRYFFWIVQQKLSEIIVFFLDCGQTVNFFRMECCRMIEYCVYNLSVLQKKFVSFL